MQEVISQITGMRRRAWVLLLIFRVTALVAAMIGCGIVLALADYLFRFPGAARLVLDGVVLAGLVGALWRWIVPAIVFWPSLTDVSLRVERLIPNLRGHLASGVEFATAGIESDSALAREAVAEARRRVVRENLGTVLDGRRTLAGASALVGAVAILSALIGLAPGESAIAARRWINPMGSAKWPARTAVLSAMSGNVHARGVALPLRARIDRGFADGMRVYAHYRIESDRDKGRWEQVILTQQQSGNLFERLIDADGDAVEVWFESADDRTEVQRIAIVEPPQIAEARLAITPPDYAMEALGVSTADLGPGTDERSILAAPALAGSEAELTLTLNKAIGAGEGSVVSATWKKMLGLQTADGSDVTDLVALATPDAAASNRWTLTWTLTQTTRLAPVLVDEYGLTGPDDVFYRLDVRPDSVPTVTILEPTSDQTCLPTAYVNIESEARDDVRVQQCTIETAVNLPPAGGDHFEDESAWRTIATAPGLDVVVKTNAQLDLSTLGVKVGDVVTIRSSATDVYAMNGQFHEPAHSAPRLVRIISQAQFVEQLYQNLSSVRENAIRIEAQQSELNERVSTSAVRTGDVRDQARISQQIARQRDALDEAANRLRENRLDDRSIQALIDEARSLVDQAGQSSESAAEALSNASMSDQPDSDPERARQDALADQKEVSERLADVISLLDEGRDSWVMRREIERLRQEQEALKQSSSQTTDQTRGQNADQLTEAQRQALDALAARQQDLARQADDLIKQLRERADQVEDQDSDLSQAMRDAASQAQQRGLAEQMDQAAQQLSDNQGQRASNSQQQAMDTLGQMLEGLESIDRARAQRLQRDLASLVQSIQALIAQQEKELNAFFAAGGQFAELVDGMYQLNVNTFSVEEMSRKAGRELAMVSGHLETAGQAQADALDEMRQSAPEAGAIQTGEERSLQALRDARDAAQKIQDQLKNDEVRRQRQELIEAYQALYERELALAHETKTLEQGGELDRRGRIRAQQLGREQAIIRTDAAQMLLDVEGLADSIVFRASHEQIDRLTEQVADALLQGEVGPIVQMREGDAADRFAALAKALADSVSQDEFTQDQSSSGGGGGGGGGGGPQPLIPPASQLKLLRSLQDAVYHSTRLLDESGAALDSVTRTQRMGEIGDAQAQIADLAQQLIKELLPPGNRPEGPEGSPRGGQEP